LRRFEKKNAVVTGASSGIGKAIALALAAEGALVALIGRDEARLAEVAHAARPAQTTVLTAEFCDNESVALLASTLARTFATVDCLVHSAGMIKLAPLLNAPLQDLDTHFRCNVRAPAALTQKLLPALTAARGTVVFINSSVVDHARAGIGYYSASKQALKAIADSLRDEVNGQGVRVLSLFLGRTATPMQESVCRAEHRGYDAARLIQPSDVAALVLDALASPPTVELTNVHLRPALPPA